MATKWLFVAPVAGALGIGAGIGFDQLLSAGAPGDAKQDVKPAVTLPITRVVLFNSGVGYFSRSGEVADDARVDLTFPEQDINDLLKSMVLEDFNGGRIAAVSYDSREPITRTLASFAVNLNGNPTFAGIVSQMRGERVEVVITPGAANQPGKLNGVIVGVETQEVAGIVEGVQRPAVARLVVRQALREAEAAIHLGVRHQLERLASDERARRRGRGRRRLRDGNRAAAEQGCSGNGGDETTTH